MLKYFMILPISLITVNCSTTRDYKQLTEQVADYGLQRLDDKSKGVSCYVYRDRDNSIMSCIKFKGK